jgi:hypothetical protein
MARIAEAEKRELSRHIKMPAREPMQPLHRPVPVLAYIEFATFANHFSRATKPVRFQGDHWKL